MLGDDGVSILVCLSLLLGIVFGLKFNVKFLLLLCLTLIVGGTGSAMAGFSAPGQSALMVALAVVALQVGYFVAVVISAMRLTEEPVGAGQTAATRERGRNPLGARRS